MTVWLDIMNLEFEQRYWTVDGHQIRCLVAGSGPPLIMLHSGGGFAESYARNLAAHAAEFTVYVPDLPGSGLSEAPDGDIDLATLVRFVGSFQDAIGAPTVALVGTSVGAWVAALYAGARPDRVSRLVLNCGVPLPPDDHGRREFVERTQRSHGSVTEDELRDSNRATFLRLFARAEDFTDELAELSFRLNWRPAQAERTRRTISGLLSEMILETETSTIRGPAALRSITAPTLIVWTRVNPGQPIALAEAALELLADGDLYVCDAAGHWPHWEAPEDYNAVELRFLTADAR